MKINPVSSASSLQSVNGQTGRAESLKTIKMNVNQTPYPAGPAGEGEPSIPPTSEEPKEPVTEATEPISPQFAALARQRRALQVKERELREKEKALAEGSSGTDHIPLARLKSEPLKVMLENGVTFEQLTEAILANQANPELNALKAEMSALKDGVEKRFTDQQEQAIKNGLASKSREIDSVLEDDAYELVRTTGSKRKVLELIERTFRDTREELDAKEALRLYEDHLFKQNQKLANTKKLQGLFTKQPEQTQPVQQRTLGMRTLTNKDTASVPMDRRARAFAAFYGTLKK